MNLSRFETYLRFPETGVCASPALSVYRVLTGRDWPKASRPREPGVRLLDKESKSLVVWEYGSCTVLFEDNPDADTCITHTLAALDRIHQVAPVQELELVRLRVDWLLLVNAADFKTLERGYRARFFHDSPVFDHCVDSSVVIDLRLKNWSLHHQSGAMDIAQLEREYRVFPVADKLTRPFLFVNNMVTKADKTRYSNKEIRGFLDEAFRMCKNHTALFREAVEGIL